MPIVKNTGIGPSGTTVTLANSTNGGNPWDSISSSVNGSSTSYDRSVLLHGNPMTKFTSGTSQGSVTQQNWTAPGQLGGSAITEFWMRGYWYIPSGIITGALYHSIFTAYQSGVGIVSYMWVNSSQQFAILNSDGTVSQSSAVGRVPWNKIVRFELHAIGHPTAGFAEGWIYTNPESDIEDEHVSISSVNTRAPADEAHYGPDGNQNAGQVSTWGGKFAFSSVGKIGPAKPNPIVINRLRPSAFVPGLAR